MHGEGCAGGGVPLGRNDGVAPDVAVGTGVVLDAGVGAGVPLGRAVGVGDADGVGDGRTLGEGLALGVGHGVADADGRGEWVGKGRCVRAGGGGGVCTARTETGGAVGPGAGGVARGDAVGLDSDVARGVAVGGRGLGGELSRAGDRPRRSQDNHRDWREQKDGPTMSAPAVNRLAEADWWRCRPCARK